MGALRKELEVCPGKTVLWGFACVPLNSIAVSFKGSCFG